MELPRTPCAWKGLTSRPMSSGADEMGISLRGTKCGTPGESDTAGWSCSTARPPYVASDRRAKRHRPPMKTQPVIPKSHIGHKSTFAYFDTTRLSIALPTDALRQLLCEQHVGFCIE